MKRKNKTCIAGLEHKGTIYMGGDSAAISEEDGSIEIRPSSKVFIKKGPNNIKMLLGFSGSIRSGQLIKHALEIPAQEDKNDEEYLVTTFTEALRKCYKDNGHIKKPGEREESDIEFLLGFNGKLYTVYEDFDVGHTNYGYAACGCGAMYAMGALWLMSEDKDVSPEDKVWLAIAAAAAHNSWVQEPFTILKL